MLTHSRNLFQAKDLVWSWVGRTIRGRYQQSALGWLWAIIQPAAQVAVFSLVFVYVVPIDTGDIPYPVFSYVAVVPWTFLVASLTDMTTSLVINMNLVTKIYFPREVIPLGAMLARLMDFGIALSLLFILMLFFQMPISPTGFLYLPLILAIQFMLVLGLGLAGAALNVFYRDVQSLLSLSLQIWFYASPIIYPVTMVPERLRQFYFLNPMVGILEAYRDVLLHGRAPGYNLLISAVVALIVFGGGYWLFKRVEFQFADIV